jgi:hypothetical protein
MRSIPLGFQGWLAIPMEPRGTGGTEALYAPENAADQPDYHALLAWALRRLK